MNVSFSISSPTIQPSNTDTVDQTQKTNQADKNLVVTLTSDKPVNNWNDTPIAITLSYPLVGPEDVAINEFLQHLQSLDPKVFEGMTMTSAVLALNKLVTDSLAGIIEGGVDFVRENADKLEEFFKGVEDQAAKAQTQLFDLINSSTYPEFNDFLSMMLNAAMDMRKAASEARTHLVKAEFENTLEQAKSMFTSAEKTYKAAIEDIEAAEKQAIGKIVSGSIGIVAGVAGGIAGARTPNMGFLAGAQAGGLFGSALGNITDGITSLMATSDQRDAAQYRKEAADLDAGVKLLEATGKLMQEAQAVTQELKDLAKSLADMVLKLYQDFMSNQSQIVQRANI